MDARTPGALAGRRISELAGAYRCFQPDPERPLWVNSSLSALYQRAAAFGCIPAARQCIFKSRNSECLLSPKAAGQRLPSKCLLSARTGRSRLASLSWYRRVGGRDACRLQAFVPISLQPSQ